jgi:hypothetical protein
MKAGQEQLNIVLDAALMKKLRNKQVIETSKANRAVSLQKIIVKLIEDMPDEQASEWQALMSHVRDMVESQPAEMSIPEFQAYQQRLSNVQRSDYFPVGNSKYATPVAFYNSEAD